MWYIGKTLTVDIPETALKGIPLAHYLADRVCTRGKKHTIEVTM